MVDKVKFYIYNVGEQIVAQEGWKLSEAKTNKYKITYFKFITNKKAIFSKNMQLYVLLEFNRKTGEYNLIVRGSLRKWYFGKNVRRDLKKHEYIRSLVYLSKELEIPLKKIVQSNITQVELGTTLVLNGKYRKILTGLVSYPKLQRKEIKESLYFGDKFKEYKKRCSYHIIFYDKLKEIYKNDKQKLKQLEPIHDKIYFCRFEISLNKLSQVVKFKKEVKTFRKLLDNWDEVQTKMLEHFDKILYVDYISDFKLPVKVTNATQRKWDKYNEIQSKTLPVLFNEIDQQETTNKTNKKRQLVNFIENNSEGNYKNLKLGFKEKLQQKLENLSNSKP